MHRVKEELDCTELIQEAQTRWLRPVEILFILQNYQKFKLNPDPPNKPQSGSVFLFDRKILRFFRKDGYNWRKKKDGKTVREAHERLKVGNADALHCYYAHGEDNPNFQRRSYWMLEEAYEHIVLVHYREVTEGKFSAASVPNFTKDGFLSVKKPQFVSTHAPNSSDVTGAAGAHTTPSWISYSPGSVEEVSSNSAIENDEIDSGDDIEKNEDIHTCSADEASSSTHQEASFLQQLSHQLSLELDDSTYSQKNPSPSCSASDMWSMKSNPSTLENGLLKQDMLTASLEGGESEGQHPHENESQGNPQNLNIDILLQNPDAYLGQRRLRRLPNGGSPWCPIEIQEGESNSPSWKEMLELCTTSMRDKVLESNISLLGLDSVDKSLVEASLDSLSPKPQMYGLQRSSEQNKLWAASEKENPLFASEGENNRWKGVTYFQGQWPREKELGEKQTSEHLQYQYTPSTRHVTSGTNNPMLSSITMPSTQVNNEHELNLYVASTNSSYWEEGIEKFRKSNSFSWLEDDDEISATKTNFQSEYYGVLFAQQSNMEAQQLEADSSVTVAQVQRFSIREFSPDWAYSTEGTKVLLTGDFIGNPSDFTWHCMFGDIEVPVEVIQQGVLCCKAPPHAPGKLPFCITCGNREACSEIREFEYRVKPSNYVNERAVSSINAENSEEVLLQVRFARMLLSERNGSLPLDFMQKEDCAGFKDASSQIQIVSDDQWEQIECALGGVCESLAYTKEWLLQVFLKERLNLWLLRKSNEEQKGVSVLNNHGQGVLHMAAALGYEWALSPILNAGIGINFRDARGWTALHWAAHFGREKVVAALIAAGASAGAVTDPTPKYPAGRTAADVAAAIGHGGIAGYLAEASLTSHLSVLTLGENEISKASAVVEADRAVESISDRSSVQQTVGATEDQLSFKDSLAAVRNSAQAAARIQAAFRAHSFRKRQQTVQGIRNEYGMTEADVHGISAVSKIQRALRGYRDQKLNKAATCIQRKFRGWKYRKEFLTLRQHVVKIQAHFRGHQVRKKYKELLWTVGILDKAILRWRRKGAGLRGFRVELPEGIGLNEENDDDILKVFRKQKVDVALDEAVARVLHMVDSPGDRHQYRRMLESYQQAKAEYHGQRSEASQIPEWDLRLVEDEYMALLEQ